MKMARLVQHPFLSKPTLHLVEKTWEPHCNPLQRYKSLNIKPIYNNRINGYNDLISNNKEASLSFLAFRSFRYA